MMKKFVLLFVLTIFIYLNNGEIHQYENAIINQSDEYREHYARGYTLVQENMWEVPFDTNTETQKTFGWSFNESTTYIIPTGKDGYALGIYRMQDVKKIVTTETN